jgi:predicted acetyltransferase
VALVQVDFDDVRLGRLLQLYIHEWSNRVPASMGEDALFAYPDLPCYRDQDSHAAFLIVDPQDGRRPVGFALAMRDETTCWHVEEFFVIAGVRRGGIGCAAARALFATRSGRWTLTVRPENPAALAFWRRVAPDAEERLEVGRDGVSRTRFSFTR